MKLIKRKTTKSNKAFSLVEVLLAVLLLALIITPILQCIYTTLTLNAKSRKALSATDLCQHILEDFEADSFEHTYTKLMAAGGYELVTGKTVTGAEQKYLIKYANAKSEAETYYNAATSSDTILLRNVTYNKYKFDVLIDFDSSAINGSDEYHVVTITVEAYEIGKDADGNEVHADTNAKLVSVKGSVMNKY